MAAPSTEASNLKQIYVALEQGANRVPVGIIRFDTKAGFGFFTYLSDYSGPPLDPVNLDYRKPFDRSDRFRRSERVFVADPAKCPGLMHQVFVDGMPGQWGMAVLQAEYPEIRQMRDAERLHWMGSRSSGALHMFVSSLGNEHVVHGLDELEVVRKKCAEFMRKLEKMGLQGIRNPAVASHGGVMPKAAYEDGNGRAWIAKFDRPGEGIQYALLEHLTCEMARKAGINVPETRAIPDGMGSHLFLAERFDVTESGRYHKASLMTLTGAKEAGTGDYRDMFRVLKDICDPVAWPSQRDELLRRLAFNVGLNVTDDHLRNHEVRLMEDGTWQLSPAFDLVPVSGPSPHQCAVFGKARADINLDKPATKEFWTAIAREIGVTPEHALGIVRTVGAAIKSEWPAMVESRGLNSFNQMSALMAAEVGCAEAFPGAGKAKQAVPLSKLVAEQLRATTDVVAKTMAVIKRGAVAPGDAAKLARALMVINEEAPKLANGMRLAGYGVAADAVMASPLRAAADAVSNLSAGIDGRLVVDLEELNSHIGATLKSAQVKEQAKAGDRPTPT